MLHFYLWHVPVIMFSYLMFSCFRTPHVLVFSYLVLSCFPTSRHDTYYVFASHVIVFFQTRYLLLLSFPATSCYDVVFTYCTTGGGVRSAGLPLDLAGHERVRYVRVANHYGYQHARLLRVRLFAGQARTFVSPPHPLPFEN